MNQQEAIKLLLTMNPNKFFRVCYRLKDGTVTWRTVRIKAPNYLHGGQPAYDSLSKGLLVVADIDKIRRLKQGITVDASGKPIKSVFISINLNTVQEIRYAGKRLTVKA